MIEQRPTKFNKIINPNRIGASIFFIIKRLLFTNLVSTSSSSTSSMHVGKRVQWKIKINYWCYILEVNTPSKSWFFIPFAFAEKISHNIIFIFFVNTLDTIYKSLCDSNLFFASWFFRLSPSMDFSSEAINILYTSSLNWETAWHLDAAGNSEFNTHERIPNCSRNNFNLQKKKHFFKYYWKNYKFKIESKLILIQLTYNNGQQNSQKQLFSQKSKITSIKYTI